MQDAVRPRKLGALGLAGLALILMIALLDPSSGQAERTTPDPRSKLFSQKTDLIVDQRDLDAVLGRVKADPKAYDGLVIGVDMRSSELAGKSRREISRLDASARGRR